MTQVPPDHSARSCDVTELTGIVQPPGGWSFCMRGPKEEAGGGGTTQSYRDREEGLGPAELLLLWGQGGGTALGVHGHLPDALELPSPP